MPDLIIMPKSHNFSWHIHESDSQFHGAMARQNPKPMNQVADFSQDLSDIVKIWDDELYGTTFQPRISFWSLDDFRLWVRDNASSDVYAQHAGLHNTLYAFSTDKKTIDALVQKSACVKNHRITARVDATISDQVSKWIQENCTDKTEVILGWPNYGFRENDYSFRSLADLTLFTVRWQGAIEIVE